MPNHVECDLKITGEMEIIKTLINRYRTGTVQQMLGMEKEELFLDANKIIPYPEKFRIADEKYKEAHELYDKGELTWAELKEIPDGYNNGGYDWCCKNWGTKWGMYDFDDIKFGKTFVMFKFLSAWAPPLPLVKKMSEDFPDLVFSIKFYDGGAQFKGHYKVKAGDKLEDKTEEYKGRRGG